MTDKFRCGHERTPENTQRSGLKPSGEQKVRCKTCHAETRALYRKAAMQRYRDKDRTRYNEYQAAWKRTDRLVTKLVEAIADECAL